MLKNLKIITGILNQHNPSKGNIFLYFSFFANQLVICAGLNVALVDHNWWLKMLPWQHWNVFSSIFLVLPKCEFCNTTSSPCTPCLVLLVSFLYCTCIVNVYVFNTRATHIRGHYSRLKPLCNFLSFVNLF